MAKPNVASIKKKMEAFATANQGAVAETVGEKSTTLLMSLPVNDGVQISITVSDTYVMCETVYSAQGKRFTFNRLGVEDSFYYESLAKLPEQFAAQIERAKARQEQLAKSEALNMGPVTIYVTPERKQEIIDKLKSGKTHEYFPSGFGTGYHFSIRFRKQRFAENIKASAELERLVGQRVFITSFDAD